MSTNTSTGRQHYRLYAIRNIPSLKVLDMTRITPAEREKAQRLARSAAGAALETDVQQEAASNHTFTPGEGQSAQESFQTSFTPEQKDMLRDMVANAKSPQEIEQIEKSVQKGVFPSHLWKPPQNGGEDKKPNGSTGDSKKRPAENGDDTSSSHKKAKK